MCLNARTPLADHTSPTLWERFQTQRRANGAFLTLQAALFTRLARLGFHLFLVELGDDDTRIHHPELPPGYTTRPVALEELRHWVGEEHGLTHEFLDGAIARGDRCVGNFHGDRLVGYGFVTRAGAPVTDQLEVTIEPWLLYRFKGWTHPEHRRRHLSHSRGRVNRTLFPLEPGMRTVDYVAVQNLASRLKHADVHPVRLGYCGYLRFFGREIPFTNPVPRRFGFRLRRRHYPAAQPAAAGG